MTPAEIAEVYGIGESTARAYTSGLKATGRRAGKGSGRLASTYDWHDVAEVAKARGRVAAPLEKRGARDS